MRGAGARVEVATWRGRQYWGEERSRAAEPHPRPAQCLVLPRPLRVLDLVEDRLAGGR